MTSNLVIILFLIVLTLICTYALYMRVFINGVGLKFSSKENHSNSNINTSVKDSNTSFRKVIYFREQSEDDALKMRKLRRQLERNLRTLNYIIILESNYRQMQECKRIEEVVNLKENLQREIIRNTRLLNNYNNVMANTQHL